jgi:alpha-ketoglutarate-dependent dioxygenase FTO
MRVEPDAEGPSAKKLKSRRTNYEATDALKKTPPVACALPDKATYYMLDDFNHHHQHSVLPGSHHRWASTHRVGRTDGHTYSGILAKCQSAVNNPYSSGSKQLRVDQLALNEVEFEWIRQYYAQGERHYDLHSWWHTPIQTLARNWARLEERTAKAVSDLKQAAEGVEKLSNAAATLPKEDQRRAYKNLSKTLKRLADVTNDSYDTLAEHLTDRAGKRQGWNARYNDPIFKIVDKDCRPMTLPLFLDPYTSTLPSDPQALLNLAAELRGKLKESFMLQPPLPSPGQHITGN